jgi:uncharacterized phage protein (TIGR01671 family)
MNREIKFRAWHKVKNIMVYDNEDDTYGDWEGCCVSNVGMINTILNSQYYKEYEFMQYTGLHDKNGKEIYEGDIVLLDCYYYEEPAFDGEFKVIYDNINGMWLLVDLENKDRGFAFGEIRSYYKAEIEVIGNIYDNPELLGGEDEC